MIGMCLVMGGFTLRHTWYTWKQTVDFTSNWAIDESIHDMDTQLFLFRWMRMDDNCNFIVISLIFKMKNSYGWQEMITSNSHLILVRIWNEWGGQSIREEIASKVFRDIDFWPSYQPGSGTGYEIPNLLLGPKLIKIRLRPCQTHKV
jgi:hypothetical protein